MYVCMYVWGKSSSGILKQTKPASKSEVAKGPKRAIQSRKRTTTKDFVKVYADAYLGKAANLQLPQYMYLLRTFLIIICFSSLKFVLA